MDPLYLGFPAFFLNCPVSHWHDRLTRTGTEGYTEPKKNLSKNPSGRGCCSELMSYVSHAYPLLICVWQYPKWTATLLLVPSLLLLSTETISTVSPISSLETFDDDLWDGMDPLMLSHCVMVRWEAAAYVNLMPVKTLNRKKIQQARLETLGGTVAVVLLNLVHITMNA
jgi:hypothetical protein